MTSQESAVTRTKSFGVVAGMATTVRNLFRRAHTQSYPDVKPDLPPRTRGVIALLEENCTACMLCARECPDWCIYIDANKEAVEVPGSDKPRQRNVLNEFSIDFSLCMYCGICIEVCPFDALFWTPEFEYTEYDIGDLLHDKERLREWMPTVPAPVTEDVLGEPAPEVVAASAPPKPVRARPGAKAAASKEGTTPVVAKRKAPESEGGPAVVAPKAPNASKTVTGPVVAKPEAAEPDAAPTAEPPKTKTPKPKSTPAVVTPAENVAAEIPGPVKTDPAGEASPGPTSPESAS